jgi:putative flippase GtrA
MQPGGSSWERSEEDSVSNRRCASGDAVTGYCRGVVERLKHYLLVRHGHNWVLLFRFALVGASGVLVNLFVAIMCKKLGPDVNGVFFDLPFTDFNVRWYHVYSTIAFLVANLWNFELNRLWTFRSARHAGWAREYFPFLTVGILAQIVGLGILTLLMHPNSPISLPATILDDSTGFRTRFYWAQLITIAIVTPISFLLNKLWTFSAVRSKHQATEPSETVETQHPTGV